MTVKNFLGYTCLEVLMLDKVMVGIIARPTNSCNRYRYMVKMLNLMGFENKEQYIEAYPYKMAKDSALIKQIPLHKQYLNDDYGRDVFENLFFLYQSVDSDTKHKAPQKLMKLIRASVKNERGSIFMMPTPTLNEMKRIAYKWDWEGVNLWFCSDWKDPYDDTIDKETITVMDHSMANLKKGIVSPKIDLSDFEEK